MEHGVDRRTMQTIDRRATEEFGIPDLVLMENAGLRSADEILESYGDRAGTTAVFCGRGKNGGDGCVVARHLFLAGKTVKLFLIARELPTEPSTQTNLAIVRKLGLPVFHLSAPVEMGRRIEKEGPFGLLVDALLGIGLATEVREPQRSAIEILNRLKVPIVSLDLPSGLSADTGEILGVCVQAQQTITFGLAKRGLFQREGPKHAGRIVVKPISLPIPS